MAGETVITVVGNLTKDPEVRMVGETPLLAITIASTPRTFNRQANEWQDGETLFLECAIWGDKAYEVAADAYRGTKVIAQVQLEARSWENRDGEKRTKLVGRVLEIGPAWLTPRREAPRRERRPAKEDTDQGWVSAPPAPAAPPATQADNYGWPSTAASPSTPHWEAATVPHNPDEVPF